MPETSRDLLQARLKQLLASGKRRILGLVGAPGSGKSTLADELVASMPGRAIVVPMDGFHLANIELMRLRLKHRKGAEATFDSAGYISLHRRLHTQSDTEVVYAPAFSRDLDEAVAGAIPVFASHTLVVTEGNYLLLEGSRWSGARALLDEAWYLDLDPSIRQARLIARHMRFGRDEQAASSWVTNVDEPNAVLIESSRSRADLIVTSEITS
jgi:pantothenate kinase